MIISWNLLAKFHSNFIAAMNLDTEFASTLLCEWSPGLTLPISMRGMNIPSTWALFGLFTVASCHVTQARLDFVLSLPSLLTWVAWDYKLAAVPSLQLIITVILPWLLMRMEGTLGHFSPCGTLRRTQIETCKSLEFKRGFHCAVI